LFVVIWEPKHGRGGGHQAVLDKAKAEKLCHRLAWAHPENVYRIEPAENYAAAAVLERHNAPTSRRVMTR
jgi:hypothetical protein